MSKIIAIAGRDLRVPGLWPPHCVQAIEAGACELPVPERWLSFASRKQDAKTGSCALHCVAAAGVHFDLVCEAMPSGALLQALNPAALRRGITLRCNRPGPLSPEDLATLAATAGLGLRVPTRQELRQFAQVGGDGIWVAMVRQRFTQPREGAGENRQSSVVRSHYVLVLDYLSSSNAVVVFDPHPWNPTVYCVTLEMFAGGWLAARRTGQPWAGLLVRCPAARREQCSRSPGIASSETSLIVGGPRHA